MSSRRSTLAMRMRGVTLIELMIAIVVVSILASIAVPSYQRYVIRSQRAVGKSELLATAAALERCFARLNAYDDPGCAAAAALPRTLPDGRYQIQVAFPTATTFTLSAVPQGRQASDAECKTMTLTHLNERGVTGGASQPASYCWAR